MEQNLFNLSVEDSEGNPILPTDISKGNAFAAQFLPRPGEEVLLNGLLYKVEQTLHELSPEHGPKYSIRVK